MNNAAISSAMIGRKAYCSVPAFLKNDVSMLRAELELMLDEDAYLKKVAGAAALLVARLDRRSLSGGAVMAAYTLAELIEGMPDDMVSEAVSLVKS